MEKSEPPHAADATQRGRDAGSFLEKLKIGPTTRSSIPRLGICPKELKSGSRRDGGIPAFPAAPFTGAKTQTQTTHRQRMNGEDRRGAATPQLLLGLKRREASLTRGSRGEPCEPCARHDQPVTGQAPHDSTYATHLNWPNSRSRSGVTAGTKGRGKQGAAGRWTESFGRVRWVRPRDALHTTAPPVSRTAVHACVDSGPPAERSHR